MYSHLIDIIKDYVYKSGAEDFEQFQMIFNCSNLLLEERKFKLSDEYSRKFDFKKIDSLVEEFLYELNPSYLDYYRLRKDDGSFIFNFNDKTGFAYSTFNDDINNREIYVGITGYIEDAFSIVHELFHDMNMTGEVDSEGREFFSECLSIVGEFLFNDFIVDKNIVDQNVTISLCLYCLRMKALEVNFNLRLIQEYLSNGFLSDSIINNIINSYSEEFRNYIFDIIDDICEEEWPTLDDNQTYILSCLCATYMYDRIKNNKKYLDELFDLNQVLNDFDLSQVLDYLDLNHSDFDLTCDCYSLLRKKYKEFVKRW